MLEWKCTICGGTGFLNMTKERHTDWWEHTYQYDVYQVQCSACKGTGKLPYRKENKVLFNLELGREMK